MPVLMPAFLRVVRIAADHDLRDMAWILTSIRSQTSPLPIISDFSENLVEIALAVLDADVAYEGDVGEGVEFGDFLGVAGVGAGVVA